MEGLEKLGPSIAYQPSKKDKNKLYYYINI